MLGILLAVIVIAPVFGVGAYLFRKGGQEQREMAQVEKEKQILNAVLTRGQVTINELVAEMQLPREDIERMIQDLVGKQLFSGAVNWQKGVLYSVESQKLTGDSKCPNCGGDLVFAGKGLIVCPYCGSQVFLTKRAAEATAGPQRAPRPPKRCRQPPRAILDRQYAREPATIRCGIRSGCRNDSHRRGHRRLA